MELYHNRWYPLGNQNGKGPYPGKSRKSSAQQCRTGGHMDDIHDVIVYQEVETSLIYSNLQSKTPQWLSENEMNFL